MARLFRGMLDVVIFVVSQQSLGGKGHICQEIAHFLSLRHSRGDRRPVRILVSRVDELPLEENGRSFFEDTIEEKRKQVHDTIEKALHELELDASEDSKTTFGIRQGHEGGLIAGVETLDDMVKAFSTHAQMSQVGQRDLSMSAEGNPARQLQSEEKHQVLYKLAKRGKIWDILSLREWLRSIEPDCLPASSRGRVPLKETEWIKSTYIDEDSEDD